MTGERYDVFTDDEGRPVRVITANAGWDWGPKGWVPTDPAWELRTRPEVSQWDPVKGCCRIVREIDDEEAARVSASIRAWIARTSVSRPAEKVGRYERSLPDGIGEPNANYPVSQQRK